MKNVVIYGTKSRAIEILDYLKSKDDIDVIGLVAPVYETNCYERNINTVQKAGEICKKPVIPITELFSHTPFVDRIIFPKLNIQFQWQFWQLRCQGIPMEKIYIAYNERIGKSEPCIEPYMTCGYLPYLEFHIEDSCNLNCRGCEHFSPLVSHCVQPNIEKFANDLDRLKTYIDEIGLIRILGGEPLLNPNIGKFIEICRQAYPEAEICVVTNGILLLKMSNAFWTTLLENNASIHISCYPPISNAMSKIAQIMDKWGVRYTVSEKIDNFYMRNYLEPVEEKEKAFSQCFQSLCCNLYDGKLAACFLPFTQHYFNETFHKDIPSDGMIDLYDEKLNTFLLKSKLYTPIERCRYCGNAVKKQWQQANTQNPCLEDWIVN